MAQVSFPATFMRGGSSKGVFFRNADLPDDPAFRDRILLAVLGSPDPYQRQLNGLGGGLSSVSKAVIIGPSTRPDADVDYTFAQVDVAAPAVHLGSNCGNLSSAVGPFAIDTGLVDADGAEAEVMIHNTNTRKLIRARLPVTDGAPEVEGSLAIPGVAGTGAGIRLDFMDPAGPATGALLPTGRPVDTLSTGEGGTVEASMVDSSNPCVFLQAERFGLEGTEGIDALDADTGLAARLERIRCEAAVRMGLATSPETARPNAPMIGLVAPSRSYRTLSGAAVAGREAVIAARIWSMGRIHRVLPLTGAMCLAVACRIPGSVCARALAERADTLCIATPSGVLPLDASVRTDGGAVTVEQVTAWRTARILMKGEVFVPRSFVSAMP